MTNKTVTFTFENPTQLEPKITQVSMGLSPLDSTTAQKATTVMTNIFTRFFTSLEVKDVARYAALMASKQFTASFEMPENGGKFQVRFFNGTNVDIYQPLSVGISKSLKDSLAKVVSVAEAQGATHKSPYLPASDPQDLLLCTPVKRLQNPTRRVTVKTAKDVPPSHWKIYLFFAAIGNFFISLVSSDTSEKPKRKANAYTPLVPRGRKSSQGSTFASTAQAKIAEVVEQGIVGIRPLQNGNNICFVNAVFQALVNMPEMIQPLIAAHDAKIAKEMGAILDLEEEITLEESSYFFPWSSAPRRVQLRELGASREASITLNQALRTYTDGTKNPVWLNALRGFDSTFGSGSQEDANDLLVKIFDPLLEPLRNGVNAEGVRDMSIIPADLDPALRDSLARFIPKFGEEKQLQVGVATETRNLELIALDAEDVSPLPPNGLRRELVASSILPFAIPNTRTALQTLVTEQLQMQNTQADDTSVYEAAGVRGDYHVTQKRIAIESLNKNAPEYISIQLKRFNSDMFGNISKNNSEIVLPANNRITLFVDGKDVEFEIQTLVMHRGETPRGGHYFSYVRKGNDWFEANDSRVAPLARLPASARTEAYLIVLKRVH